MKHNRIGPILLIIMLSTVVEAGCTQAQRQITPAATAVAPCETASIEESNTGFESITLGKTTEEEVLKLLGKPIHRDTYEGLVSLQYDTSKGWIILKGDVAVVELVLLENDFALSELVKLYGTPAQVIRRIRSGTAINSSTFLLYPCQGILFEILEARYAFVPETRVERKWRVTPDFYEEFLHEQGLDGRSNDKLLITAIEVIAWPGFMATPAP